MLFASFCIWAVYVIYVLFFLSPWLKSICLRSIWVFEPLSTWIHLTGLSNQQAIRWKTEWILPGEIWGDARWKAMKSSGIIWKHMKSIIVVLSACISCILSSLLFEVGCCPGFTVPIQIPKVSQPQWITSSCVRTCKLMTKIIAWHLQVLWGSWSQGWRNESTKEGVETIHMSRGTVQMMTEALTQKAKARVKKGLFFLPSIQFCLAAVLLSVLPPCRDLSWPYLVFVYHNNYIIT